MGRSDHLDICSNDDSQLEKEGERKEIFFQSLLLNVHENYEAQIYGKEGCDRLSIMTNSKDQDRSFTMDLSASEFDKIVSSTIKPHGFIRTIKYYANENTGYPILIYNIGGYRFCQNINGDHFSNNVYFVANIRKRLLYQKCYNCTDYSGSIVKLPEQEDLVIPCLKSRSKLIVQSDDVFADTSASYESLLYSTAQLYDVNDTAQLYNVNDEFKTSAKDYTIGTHEREVSNRSKGIFTQDIYKFASLLMLKFGQVPPVVDRNCWVDSNQLYDIEFPNKNQFTDILENIVILENKVT